MSIATLQALEEAFQAHLADIRPDDGETVVSWAGIMAYTTIESIDTDHRHGYRMVHPESASFHEVAGMIHIAEMQIQSTWNAVDDN